MFGNPARAMRGQLLVAYITSGSIPVVEEIGGIIIGDEFGNGGHFIHSRDIIIEALPNIDCQRFQRISELHLAYFPSPYPFMFLNGEHGWHPSIPLPSVNLEANPNLNARRQEHFVPDEGDNENQTDQDDEDALVRGSGGSVRVSQARF